MSTPITANSVGSRAKAMESLDALLCAKRALGNSTSEAPLPNWLDSTRVRHGSPGVTRTPDQRFRKPLLYPSELRGHSDATPLSHVSLRRLMFGGHRHLVS